MRIWLSKNSDVPVREQLVSQIIAGVVSNDLQPGQKLPSTRELARRFGIHSNTVSAAYRHLAGRGWVEFRKGSGVYVRAHNPESQTLAPGLELDGLISSFLRTARDRGFSLIEIQGRVKHWLELEPPDHFLVIEPDAELRRILMAEIKEATGFRVAGASVEECARSAVLAMAAPVALYTQAESVRAALPFDANCLLLHTRSVADSLKSAEAPPPDALVAVVSRWPEFLRWSHTILTAAGLDPAALSFRDARQPDWAKGLRASAFVITDALTAGQLPAGCQPRVYRVIADSSIKELRGYVEQFLSR
ncbi:MAG: GntR family transcriptional regulator [Blastocatellia bacterium]|jgi:GntR family transcriptional regulator|nr:GntR family transcriptional regulator [Blastocatellia bacterium]